MKATLDAVIWWMGHIGVPHDTYRTIQEIEATLAKDFGKHVHDMGDAVRQIDMSQFAEVKALAKYKNELCEVMNTVIFMLFDLEPMERHTWKLKFFERDCLKRLQEFSPDSVTEKMMQKLDGHFSDPAVSLENIEALPGPAIVKHLSRWLWAARSCGQLAAVVKPRMEEFARLRADLESLEREKALVSS